MHDIHEMCPIGYRNIIVKIANNSTKKVGSSKAIMGQAKDCGDKVIIFKNILLLE